LADSEARAVTGVPLQVDSDIATQRYLVYSDHGQNATEIK